MKWPDKIKPLIEKYSRGYAWITLRSKGLHDNKDFDKVNSRLMEIEVEIENNGVNKNEIENIQNKIKKLLDKKWGEMNNREFEFIMQTIWGKDVSIIQ